MVYRKLIVLLILGLLLLSCTEDVAGPMLINVPEDSPTIQAAIEKATNGSEVFVSPGEYHETIDFLGKSITVTSFFSTSSNFADITNTIINGDSTGSVVLFQNQENGSSRLIGFTIKNGVSGMGGGIYCGLDSSPYLGNLILENNGAGFGGGIGCYENSNPVIENCIIRNNTAYNGQGGGLCSYNSSPSLSKVDFIENLADQGGAIYGSNAALSLENCIISNNGAFNYGGGIFSAQSVISTQNCIFESNGARAGGAIYSWMYSILEISNSVLVNNSAEFCGGIYFLDGSQGEIENSIFWNNGKLEISFCNIYNVNNLTLSYNNIQGYDSKIETYDNGEISWQEGNIGQDPFFLDIENNNYKLSQISPCVDAGNPGSVYNDFDNTRNDIGAYGGPNGNW